MQSLYIIPLVWQLFGPGPLQTSYVVGNQWAVPFGAYTAASKVMWFTEAPQANSFHRARFLVIWQSNSCAAKVRLIARSWGKVDTVLGQVEACSSSEISATAERIHLPSGSRVDITNALNQAIVTYNGDFHIVYEMQNNGFDPIGFWEVRVEGWLKLR